jgi:hypothetical protein
VQLQMMTGLKRDGLCAEYWPFANIAFSRLVRSANCRKVSLRYFCRESRLVIRARDVHHICGSG